MSSSSTNSSLRPPPLPSSINLYGRLLFCFSSRAGTITITAFNIISVLFLLPLCVHVIYVGLQQRRQQRSGTTMNHSDLFTYNMVAVDLINVVGSTIVCCGVHANVPHLVILGLYLTSMTHMGQMVFHILTCVERYLAVVHPVTYLGLRSRIRIRTITILSIWLLCFVWAGLMSIPDRVFIITLTFCTVIANIMIISFCSVSVLCVLIRPRPGDGGPQVVKSKLRAFYTIVAILGVLMVNFGGNVLTTAMYDAPQVTKSERCGVWLSDPWISLPSNLVLPLLFLHKAGKLPCCKKKNPSGQGSD